MRARWLLLIVALGLGCDRPGSAGSSAAGAKPGRIASVSGEVRERLDAAPYSYLRLRTGDGEKWVAVPRAEVSRGETVTVLGAAPVAGFEVKQLGRRFELVYFGTLRALPSR